MRTCMWLLYFILLMRSWFLTHLDAKWVGNTPEELNMGTIKLASALTNPEHVGRAIVEKIRGGVLTG